MNVEIRTEAAQFLLGDYINRIFFAVYHGGIFLGRAVVGNVATGRREAAN
jgi:hypothetical protein